MDFSNNLADTVDTEEACKKLSSTLNKEFMEIIVLVQEFFKDYNKTETWLYEKNPFFGDIQPIFLISIGRGHKVLGFVRESLKENEPPSMEGFR